MEGGASHQAWVIVAAPGEPFCITNVSNFALWHSVCQGQTRRVGRFSQASLLAWMNITAWLQERKPRESNKLFDLFLPKCKSVPSVLSVVEKRAYPLAYCPPGNICGMLSIRGRCPRLLKVVPSRHQSARGVLVMRLPSRHRSAGGVLVMRLPSRHQSAGGVLVMRLPILIGHDVTHRYQKKQPSVGGLPLSLFPL